MQLPTGFTLTHPPAVAAFVLINRDNLADALYDLAAHYAPQRGDTHALTDVAAAFTDIAHRPGWLNPERATDVLRATADLHYLADQHT
ncbi:hypothetical protein ACFU0X_20510 [Streptomyces cellulosae]|uniref:Uncharacterized protein n=1 Tax=Streptomyces cellulosae TaxID=1968 RepID=A0ABW6JMP6_STRCE